jgi:hypothetical protein
VKNGQNGSLETESHWTDYLEQAEMVQQYKPDYTVEELAKILHKKRERIKPLPL